MAPDDTMSTSVPAARRARNIRGDTGQPVAIDLPAGVSQQGRADLHDQSAELENIPFLHSG
jgi:hypothetical protein